MYFPIGWPKVLNLNLDNPKNCSIRQLVCNRDKILFSVLTDDSLFIYFCKPCLLLVLHRRSGKSINDFGFNEHVEWRPDSSNLIVATSGGFLLLYKVSSPATGKGLYEQIDPPQPNLRRDSAELFIKQIIPSIHLSLEKEVFIGDKITCISCIRDELMIATDRNHILRYKWDMTLNRDYCVELNRVPFCLDQQASKAIPIVEKNTFIVNMDYSPLIGGFSIVLNDGRSAFLTAYSLKFDPNQMQGIWAPNIEDGTCSCVNHKFRLITFGRRNSQCVVYSVDETTGGLAISHHLIIPGQVYPGPIGAVHCMKWSPDACALAVAWEGGGVSLWSTFGALLLCSLAWDYGLSVDLALSNPLTINALEWSAEGYQLWMVKKHVIKNGLNCHADSVIQLGFVKSALTVNPCVSHQNHLYLQGEDRLYVNLGVGLSQIWSSYGKGGTSSCGRESPLSFTSALVDSKQWIVVQIPSTYSATNWPIRYTSINEDGDKLAVAGRAGLAHYSLASHKWKLFGNETQEKDMLVSGGLLWWRDFLVAGCYNIQLQKDELRFYPSSLRLSNSHMTALKLNSQVLLLDCMKDRILIFCADGHITIYTVSERHKLDTGDNVELVCVQAIDMSALCVHPACFVSLTLTSLRIEPSRPPQHAAQRNNFVINVSGKLLMVNQQDHNNSQTLQAPSILASCVENVWSPRKFCKGKPHLTEALWLYCGAHGMRVWLPLFPRHRDSAHTFMSKRIMLPFQLRIYPLAILFEDAILLGAENDTVLYSSDSNSPFSLPFCVLEKTSQVYLHHILRQLIRRNLGFHAWEIARCCTSLPYFPHSLELLLHEVLEEEATSKEPIPDAQLPSVIEFIQEFPVYLETVVQCARKTEIALWPYLFSVAGKPTQLFQKCLIANQLETAASYLIILQNLESSAVSRQYATMLLDSTLNSSKWELSKDLVRFLKAIDPSDVEYSRAPIVVPSRIPQTPSVNGNEEDLSLVLGTMQVARGRSFSTTTTPKLVNSEKTPGHGPHSRTSVADMTVVKRKKSVPAAKSDSMDSSKSAEEFFMDVMIERHARRLLGQHRLHELGCLAASLDFPLVQWLARERHRAAVVENPISALKDLHSDFAWPYPTLSTGSPSPSPERSSSLEMVEPASHVDDSGYMSFQGYHVQLSEQIIPQQADERSLASEADSWLCSEDAESESFTQFNPSYNVMPSPQVLDHLSKQITTKGSPKADIQLRYLLQLLMDAGCLQWALLISVLLRDAMAVYRIINATRSQDQTYEAVERLKDNIVTLSEWSFHDCLGYKPFMSVIQNQVGTLNKLIASKHRATAPTPDARHRSSSVSCSLEKLNVRSSESPILNDDLFNSNRLSDSPTPTSHVPVNEQSSCIVM